MTSADAAPGRRPIASRSRAWAIASAAWLARRGVSPNAISLASILFAAGAGAALALWPLAPAPWAAVLLLVAAAVAIQLRLVCNLLDGMVAVEGGRRTPTGDLFNEVPDRVADTLVLVGAGWGLAQTGLPWAEPLGWAAALAAMATAYIRALADAHGLHGCFLGPMAKQHRMALVTAAVAAAAVAGPGTGAWILWWALVVVAVGALVTAGRRLHRLARHLRGGAP